MEDDNFNVVNFIKVFETEESDPVEIPIESDDTILFSTLGGQFPRVCGLKYRPPNSTTYRAIKISDGKLYKPNEGWYDVKLICVFAKEGDNKRKFVEDNDISSGIKSKRFDVAIKKCTDLIILNLGWKVDEDTLKRYFKQWGDVALVQIKKDRDSGQSRGYGFVRFRDYESQVACLMSERHVIDGRVCAVKVPFSKAEADKQEISKKIHVSYTSEEITEDNLRETFNEFGTVSDIFVPKPFRNFAFVTFDNTDVVQSLIGKTLTINGHNATIGTAVPKITNNQMGINAGQVNNLPYNTGRRNYNKSNLEQVYSPNIYQQPQQYQPRNYTIWNGFDNTMASPQNAPFKSHYQNNNELDVIMTGQSGSRSSGLRQPQQHHTTYGGASMYNTGAATRLTSAHEMMQTAAPQATADNMGQNTAAMAALNILNNPDVVAAIVAAAAASGGQNQAANGLMMAGPAVANYHQMPQHHHTQKHYHKYNHHGSTSGTGNINDGSSGSTNANGNTL